MSSSEGDLDMDDFLQVRHNSHQPHFAGSSHVFVGGRGPRSRGFPGGEAHLPRALWNLWSTETSGYGATTKLAVVWF